MPLSSAWPGVQHFCHRQTDCRVSIVPTGVHQTEGLKHAVAPVSSSMGRASISTRASTTGPGSAPSIKAMMPVLASGGISNPSSWYSRGHNSRSAKFLKTKLRVLVKISAQGLIIWEEFLGL